MATTAEAFTQHPLHSSGTCLVPSAASDRRNGKAIASSDTASDVALIALVASQDKNAMRVLYARYNVRLYRFIVRLTANATLAEDAVSETFIDVWRTAKMFKAQSAVATWLYSIARNKALTALRGRTHQRLDDEFANNLEDIAGTPEDTVLEKDRSKLMQSCLAGLSPLHREVIDLVYYHEKRIHEVAQIVGASENTIKTRLHYARAHIGRILAEAGVTTIH